MRIRTGSPPGGAGFAHPHVHGELPALPRDRPRAAGFARGGRSFTGTFQAPVPGSASTRSSDFWAAAGLGEVQLARDLRLIPALKRSGEDWGTHIVRPGRVPLAALDGVLAQMNSSQRDGARDAALALGASLVGSWDRCPGRRGA